MLSVRTLACCGKNAKRVRATKEQATARTRNTSGNLLIQISIHHGTKRSGDRLTSKLANSRGIDIGSY